MVNMSDYIKPGEIRGGHKTIVRDRVTLTIWKATFYSNCQNIKVSMKYTMKIFWLKVLLLVLFSVTTISSIHDVCKYKGRQLLPGQTFTDCYSKITCHVKGVLVWEDPCPSYQCLRPSQMKGYKRFDDQKPYPACCDGPICADNEKLYIHTGKRRIYTANTIAKRSPHVMGIKFP